MSPVLLHAAAFIPDIERVALVQPLISYRSLIENRFYHSGFIPGAVAGSLNEYDLPQLAASLAPRKLLIVNPMDGAKKPVEKDAREREMSLIRHAFSRLNKEAEFVLIDSDTEKQDVLPEVWLR